jgi:hypothetical protein
MHAYNTMIEEINSNYPMKSSYVDGTLMTIQAPQQQLYYSNSFALTYSSFDTNNLFSLTILLLSMVLLFMITIYTKILHKMLICGKRNCRWKSP